VQLAPAPVRGIEGAVEIAAAARHTCARLASGVVRCWGYNGFGQLGDGSDEERETPVDVSGIDDAVGLAVGVRHGCVLRRSGGVACWGRNHEGQLGDWTTEARHAPVAVRL